MVRKRDTTTSRRRRAAAGLGSEWDRAETKRFREVDFDELRKLSIPDLRRSLFPKQAASALKPHSFTAITGLELDSPGELATRLLFFDSLLLGCCSHCLTTKRLPVASALIERGFATPVLRSRYEDFPPDVLHFLETYQENHVSVYGLHTYLNAALIRTPIKEMNEYDHYCWQCLTEAIERIEAASAGLPRAAKRALPAAYRALTSLPSYLLMHVADLLESRVKNRDRQGIWQIASIANGISTLEFYRAFEAVPTMDVDEYRRFLPAIRGVFPEVHVDAIIQEMIGFCARGLKVAYTPDLPLEEYLNIISAYRGALRSTLPTASDPTKAISKARNAISEINQEIDEITQSKRYRWGEFSVRVLSKVPKSLIKLMMRASLGGDYGAGAVLSDWEKVRQPLPGSSPRNPGVLRLKEKILSAYFRTEIPVVQVWQLRQALTLASRGKNRGRVSG